jgi:hypothetical protein
MPLCTSLLFYFIFSNWFLGFLILINWLCYSFLLSILL